MTDSACVSWLFLLFRLLVLPFFLAFTWSLQLIVHEWDEKQLHMLIRIIWAFHNDRLVMDFNLYKLINSTKWCAIRPIPIVQKCNAPQTPLNILCFAFNYVKRVKVHTNVCLHSTYINADDISFTVSLFSMFASNGNLCFVSTEFICIFLCYFEQFSVLSFIAHFPSINGAIIMRSRWTGIDIYQCGAVFR